MTTTLEVHDGGAVRAARTTELASSSAVLALLGVSPRGDGASVDAPVPLGDAIAVVADRLGLALDAPTLVSALVLEEAGAHDRVGKVRPAAPLAVVLPLAAARPRHTIFVADGADSEPSSAGELGPDVGPTSLAGSFAERLRKGAPDRDASSVVGVLSLGDACDRLFDFSGRALAGTLVPSSRRSEARAALFAAALRESRVALGWSLVADLASGLMSWCAADERASFELRFVRDVARRHEGWSALLPWPDDEELAPYDEQTRGTVLAHVVQSASDGGGVQTVRLYAERAEASLEGGSSDALELRGALGRAWAACGDYERASSSLARVVEAWLPIRPAQASRPLCELLRVEGILGRSTEVQRWRRFVDTELASALDAESRRYVDLAVGRALVQVGQREEGLEVLGAARLGADSPQHVRRSALRWRARAARELGRAELAATCEAALRALGSSDQLCLAVLDRVFADVAQTTACLEELIALPVDGTEARVQLERLAPGASPRAVAERPDTLRRLRDEARY